MLIDRRWESIESAPHDCDLEIAVIESGIPHALVFPCRRTMAGWTQAKNGASVRVDPTHWRHWRMPEQDTASP